MTNSDQYVARIVSNFANNNLTVVVDNEEDAKKNKDLAKKHPALTFPYLETMSGDIISESSAIAAHLARMNPGAGLFGSGAFQEGQVNQWVAFAECLVSNVNLVTAAIGGSAKVDEASFNNSLKKIKDDVRILNTVLNGKTWLVGNKVTLADIYVGCVLTPAFQLVLDAGFRKGHANVAKWFESFTALPEVVKAAGKI